MTEWLRSRSALEAIYVACLFGGYVILWSVKRVRQRRDTGHDPHVLGNTDNQLQRYFAQLMRALTGVVVLLFIGHAAGLDDRWGLRRVAALDSRWLDHLGLAIGLVGLALCHAAQVAMGASWRVGIDETEASPLVTRGLFRYVRNPTYLGLFLMNGGLWLIWPSCAVAAYVLAFTLAIEMQVRSEEEHLLAMHGAVYRRYMERTKRYLPGIY